jgi:hypothetical protein
MFRTETEQTAVTRHPGWAAIAAALEDRFGYRTPAYTWAIDAVSAFILTDRFDRVEHDFNMLGEVHTKFVCDLCAAHGIDLAVVAEHQAVLSKMQIPTAS